MTVLAAVDTSQSAPRVVDVARALAVSRGEAVKALHAAEGDTAILAVGVAALGVPIRVVSGRPIDAIVRALARDRGALAVLGRGRTRPFGPVTQAVMQRVTNPVVVVPPTCELPPPAAALKLLVPVDGTDATAAAIERAKRFVGDAEVVAVHVFTPETAPRSWDHWYYDYPAWCETFLSRHCNGAAVRIEPRQGEVVDAILDVARLEGNTIVALAWSRDLALGRAPVVRGILAESTFPVLLFPAAPSAEGDRAGRDRARGERRRAELTPVAA